MKDTGDAQEVCHNTHEDGADQGTNDVSGHNTAALGGIEAVLAGDQAHVGLTSDGVGHTNSFPLETEKKSEGEGQEDRTQVTELLEDQGGTGSKDLGQLDTAGDTYLGQENRDTNYYESIRNIGSFILDPLDGLDQIDDQACHHGEEHGEEQNVSQGSGNGDGVDILKNQSDCQNSEV